MISGEVLCTSPGEDRSGALRARALLRAPGGGFFDQGNCRRGEAAPYTRVNSPMNVSPAGRLGRTAHNPLPKPTRHQSTPTCARVVANSEVILPREMRSILRDEKAAA